MSQIFFSICKYLPNITNNENINLGFVYHIPSKKEISFVSSTSISRIRKFDDELSSSDLNFMFGYLKYEFSDENIKEKNLCDFLDYPDTTLLSKLLKNHVNQIQFDKIQSFKTDDKSIDSYQHAIDTIRELYLYFDTPKEKRMDKNRIASLAKKHIANTCGRSFYSLAKINPEPEKTYPFDFYFLSGSEMYYYKSFSLNYVRKNQLYKEIKIFLYDYEKYIKNNPNFTKNKFFILVNPTDFESQEEKVFLDLLKQYELHVITLKDFYKEFDKTAGEFNENFGF